VIEKLCPPKQLLQLTVEGNAMWDWTQIYARRYQKEVAGVRKEYPAARILRVGNTAHYCLSCDGIGFREHLIVLAVCTTSFGESYPIVMAYSCEFPNRMPGVWPLRSLHQGAPHQYMDHRICLTCHEYDNSVTGAQVLGMAFGWFTCYDIWLRTGIFPPDNYGKHRIKR
jgi:hypothetical protein